MEECKNKLIVANTGSNSISIIDIEKDEKVEEMYIGEENVGPHELVNKDDERVYLVNSYNNSIYKINIEKKEIEDIVFVGRYPTHIETINGSMYVVCSDSNVVTIVDEKNFSVIGSISVGEKPHDIKIESNNKKIFITNHNGYSINTIDLERNIEAKITLDCNPFHLAIIDGLMFVLCHGNKNSQIKVIDLDDEILEKSIEIDGIVVDMVKIDGEDIIYVTNAENGCLYKVDYNKEVILEKYIIGGMLNNIVCSGDRLYISDTLNNMIIVFKYDSEEITSKISVGLEPSGLLLR
ncbi:YncE family protein [Gottschalkia acidurici]|uniref:YncE family protein n=1 Tax=Clostridium acidurici TaxID=1556 RepID=UPI0002D62EA7|nr:YncE family protein [Gottschalkia acidurici]